MSRDKNQVTLLGRLVRDPVLYENKEDPRKNRLWFTLAVGRQWTDRASGEKREATEYVNCNLWAGLADAGAKHMRKGKQVLIDGRLSIFSRQVTNKDGKVVEVDGKPVYTEQATVQCSDCIYLQDSRKNQPAPADIQDTVDAAVAAALAAQGGAQMQAAAGEPTPEGDDPFDL